MAGASLAGTKTLYEELKGAWKQGNLEQCETILKKLKLALVETSFLPLEAAEEHQAEILLARDILEVATQWSVAAQDLDAFERYMAQLKTYYYDYSELVPESAYKYELLGLNLLYLLTQHKIAEFHTELERLDVDLLFENPYIRYSVSLEQYLMEGSYNKVFLARDNVPAQSYNGFLDILVSAIRENIAACIQAAYGSLSMAEFQKLTFADNTAQAEALVQEHEDWQYQNGTIIFPTKQVQSGQVNSGKLVHRTLNYAKELEDII